MRTSPPRTAHRHSLGPASRWQDYLPLVVVIAVALLAATALHVGESVPDRGHGWMLDAMGLFLAIFSMFKFFDLSGFADGFQMYDLLAKRARAYALFYPFVELGLALGYLARWRLPAVYGITVMVMLFGALGVIGALRRKLDLDCACLGTVLRVPLSTVALTEDVGMAVMAAVLWAQ